MSTFATWITEPIWCEDCAIGLSRAVRDEEDFQLVEVHMSELITSMRVFAGRVRSLSPQGCSDELEFRHCDDIGLAICHTLRVVMICDEAPGAIKHTFEPVVKGA